MTQRYIELMSVIIELKYLLPIGFVVGYNAPVEIDFMRIITTIIGTIIAGTAWVFLKPVMVRLRNKVMRKKINNENDKSKNN